MESGLDRLFHPRSIAVVGISTSSNKFGGNNWVSSIRAMGFEGEIYPVHPTLSEFNGLKVYRSVRDIPTSIDLAIVAVPARSTPQVMEDCVASSVRFVQLFTAGFAETGEKEGATLEAKVREIALSGHTRVIGPNCMGVYFPACSIAWRPDFPREVGSFSVLSQSGTNSVEIVKTGQMRGVNFSKLISYGNACDLTEIDFLEYFAADPETKIIGAYIEGVSNGARFLAVLRETTKSKPVIVLKGGTTEASIRATLSHTAAMAGTARIWYSAMQQAGAISVQNFEELIETALTFLYLLPPPGQNIALIGFGGGCTVLATDACERAGLRVPLLPILAQREMGKLVGHVGISLQNPIDIPESLPLQALQQVIRICASCSEITALIAHLRIDPLSPVLNINDLGQRNQAIIEAAKKCGKPVVVVLQPIGLSGSTQLILEEQSKFLRAGIPTYRTVDNAAQAIIRIQHVCSQRK